MTRAQHCERMRKSKAARRMAGPGADTHEVGLVFFCGPVFRGCHCVQLYKVADGRNTLDVRVDGVLRVPRTERGMRALIARKIAAKAGGRA